MYNVNALKTSDNIQLSLPIKPHNLQSIAQELQLTANSFETESVTKYIQSAIADNTRSAYQSDLAHFMSWGASIPSSPEQLAAYLAYYATELSPATLARRLVSIGKAHTAQGLSSPAKSELVKATLRGIRRTVGVHQRQVLPVLKECVVEMVENLTGFKGARDRALLLIGFAGAFRRSELVALEYADIEFVAEGVSITIRRSKTDQEAIGRKLGVPHARGAVCPVKALKEWIALSGIADGKIFRSCNRHRMTSNKGLSPQSVALIVKHRAKAVGLDADAYSGHSLRAGLVTSAAKAGVSSWKIKQQTGHKSDAMLQRYIRDSQIFIDNAVGAIL